jgi:hypothetical protein
MLQKTRQLCPQYLAVWQILQKKREEMSKKNYIAPSKTVERYKEIANKNSPPQLGDILKTTVSCTGINWTSCQKQTTAADILNCTPKRYIPFDSEQDFLADCPPQPQAQPCSIDWTNVQKQEIKKEETKMSYNPFSIDSDYVETTAAPTDQRQRDFLLQELRQAREKITWDARTTFHLFDEDRPATPKELAERITAGRFIVDKDRWEKKNYSPIDLFQWRDPAKPADQEGYDAFVKEVDKEKTTAYQDIVISDPAKGLEVLRAFTSKYAN